MEKKIWKIRLTHDFIYHEFVFTGTLTDAIHHIDKVYGHVQSLQAELIQALWG